jgi:hypothetical protein
MAQKPSSRIRRLEAFIKDHYHIRYNTISNQVECKNKTESQICSFERINNISSNASK